MTPQHPVESKPIDWRALPPVPEAERPQLDDDWQPSQSFLRTHDRCDRAAMLHLIYGAGAGSNAMNRGSVVHDVLAFLTQYAYREGENRVPVEMGKQVLRDYYAENPHMQVSAAERDAIRYMVAHWCEAEYLDPDRILAVEASFRWEVNGFVVGGHPDRVEGIGNRLEVFDYKTGFMPDREEFIPQSYSPDGRPYFAGNFQTMLYAAGLAFGVMDDGLPLGDYDEFALHFVYPRHLVNGELGRRSVLVTQLQLLDFVEDIEDQLTRLRDVNLGEGRWQPLPGNHCRECPVETLCPLPKILREESQHAGLKTLPELEKVAADANFMGERKTKLMARLKKAAERLEEERPGTLDLGDGTLGVRIGDDLAFVFQPYSRESVKDAVALQEDAQRIADYGGKLDLTKHMKPSSGTDFKRRKVGPRPRDNNGKDVSSE